VFQEHYTVHAPEQAGCWDSFSEAMKEVVGMVGGPRQARARVKRFQIFSMVMPDR